jgi:hypothetical protein
MTENSPQIAIPKWVNDKPANERQFARQRLLINIAAAYATEEGTIRAMCKALGRQKSYFARYISYTNPIIITAEIAVEVERLIGKDAVPREELAPHIFK